MAVGARRFDIMLQFLIEATTLCVLGGLMKSNVLLHSILLQSSSATSVPLVNILYTS